MKILGVATTETVGDLTPRVHDLAGSFQKAGVMTTASIIDSAGFAEGIVTGLQALQSAFFRPNVVFLKLPETAESHAELTQIIHEAKRLKIGVMLLGYHTTAGFGRQKVVNLWLRPRAGQSVKKYLDDSNQNLAILSALRIAKAWDGELNLITVVSSDVEVAVARQSLDEVSDLCRIPDAAKTHVLVGELSSVASREFEADLQIFGLSRSRPLDFMAGLVRETRTTCMFLADSGGEDALA